MIAIIPARQGSKRIKNKNIKLFNKKPLIYWVIKKLKEIKKIKKIVVTSDSDKILSIAKKYKVNLLIKRSKKTSNDNAPVQEAVKETIKKLQNFFVLKNILVVFPSSVFFLKSDLNLALQLLNKNKNKFIISVGKHTHPIQRSFLKQKNNKLTYIFKRNELKRTQDFVPTFFDAGQFYLANYKIWKEKRISLNAIGIELPRGRNIDIDTLDDWNFAEKNFKKKIK